MAIAALSSLRQAIGETDGLGRPRLSAIMESLIGPVMLTLGARPETVSTYQQPLRSRASAFDLRSYFMSVEAASSQLGLCP